MYKLIWEELNRKIPKPRSPETSPTKKTPTLGNLISPATFEIDTKGSSTHIPPEQAEEQILKVPPPQDFWDTESADSNDTVHNAVSNEANVLRREIDAHQDYLSRPFDYIDRVLAKKNEVSIDTIMVTRELKKQYRLQYKRA